jgi:hypothetical protein
MSKKNRVRARTASKEDVEIMIKSLPELSFDDFDEIVPGRFVPRLESREKFESLREIAVERLTKMDADVEALDADLAAKKQHLKEIQDNIRVSWFAVPFIRGNEGWISEPDLRNHTIEIRTSLDPDLHYDASL